MGLIVVLFWWYGVVVSVRVSCGFVFDCWDDGVDVGGGELLFCRPGRVLRALEKADVDGVLGDDVWELLEEVLVVDGVWWERFGLGGVGVLEDFRVVRFLDG